MVIDLAAATIVDQLVMQEQQCTVYSNHIAAAIICCPFDLTKRQRESAYELTQHRSFTMHNNFLQNS